MIVIDILDLSSVSVLLCLKYLTLYTTYVNLWDFNIHIFINNTAFVPTFKLNRFPYCMVKERTHPRAMEQGGTGAWCPPPLLKTRKCALSS